MVYLLKMVIPPSDVKLTKGNHLSYIHIHINVLLTRHDLRPKRWTQFNPLPVNLGDTIYIYMFMYMILYMIPSTTLMVSSMYTINSTMDIAGVVAYGYMKLNNHNIRYMMVHGPTWALFKIPLSFNYTGLWIGIPLSGDDKHQNILASIISRIPEQIINQRVFSTLESSDWLVISHWTPIKS